MTKLVFCFLSCRTTLRRAHRAVEFALTLGEEGSYMYVDTNKIDIKHHGCKWLQAVTIACSPQHKCCSSYDTCFVSFSLGELSLFNCFIFFCLSYVVLFPTRLSPKLPVLTLSLADSSTSKQKTDTEPGIFILKSYCLVETLLAMSSLNHHCHNYFANYRNCRNCQERNSVGHMFSSVVHISICFHTRLCL